MIYYFSATGNSRYLAKLLAEQLGVVSCDIIHPHSAAPASQVLPADADKCRSPLVFVFPTHAWGVPAPMSDFIRSHTWCAGAEAYMLTTCGDDIGLLHRDFRRLLRSVGLNLIGAWSILMPDTFVGLPGFSLDTPSVEHQKVSAAVQRIPHIARQILSHNRGDSAEQTAWEVNPGPLPWLKSRVLRFLFYHGVVNASRFHISPACTSCGRCVRVCPKANISISKDGVPSMGKSCIGCMACLHSCPQKAIDYWHFTRGKRRYNGSENV